MRCRLNCYPFVHYHLCVGLTQVLQGRDAVPLHVQTRPGAGSRR